MARAPQRKPSTRRKPRTQKKTSAPGKEEAAGTTADAIETTARVAAAFAKKVPDAATDGISGFLEAMTTPVAPFPRDLLSATAFGYQKFFTGLAEAAKCARQEAGKPPQQPNNSN